MSWLFGMNKKPDPTQLGVPPAQDAGAGGGEGEGGGAAPPRKPPAAMDAYRFDSSALERAAQAAKDLEKSCK